MLSMILGILGFLLYVLYDINSFRWKLRIPRIFFLLGTVLLAAAALLDLLRAWRTDAFAGVGDILLLTGGCICLGALIYCLFFALPFEETYTEQAEGRRVYDGGAYALCRHPGILCFFGMFLLWGLAALPTKMLLNGLLFSLLNLGYALFQDRVTFPRTFIDYEEYRKKIPFLIPTRTSMRMARGTFVHLSNKEDDL